MWGSNGNTQFFMYGSNGSIFCRWCFDGNTSFLCRGPMVADNFLCVGQMVANVLCVV